MKNPFLILLLILLIPTLHSCSLIGDIFEFGMWTGIIIIVLIVVFLGVIISKIRRRL